MEDEVQESEGYQIIIVNITYGRELVAKNKERPDMTVLDLPEGILKLKDRHDEFLEKIETFAYNTITRKFGAEVEHCQIFLPEE